MCFPVFPETSEPGLILLAWRKESFQWQWPGSIPSSWVSAWYCCIGSQIPRPVIAKLARQHTAAPDLLGRDFTATASNQKWVADLTRILTGGGMLWLASARDAFSNKVVGWNSDPHASTELVLSALDYAIFSRDVRGGQSIFHSDKGCQAGLNRWMQHRLVDVIVGVRRMPQPASSS